MSRLSIRNLLPDTKYAIQVRATDGKIYSQWSRVHYLTTNIDNTVPAIPTNVTWEAIADIFHGEWDAITTTASGDSAVITHYEIELVAGVRTRVVSVPQKTDGTKVTYDLSFGTNRALFGSAQTTVKMRVRAVDSVGLASAWTAQLTATNGQPSPVTNLVATGIMDGISLSWDAPDDVDVIGYNIYVGSADGFAISPTNRVNSSPVGDTVFTYNTSTYILLYVKVTAVDRFHQESSAVQASATPKSPFVLDETPPDMPTGLTASISRDDTNNATATLSWTAPTDEDLAGYVIRYKKTTDTNWSTQTIDKSLTTAVIPVAAFYDYNFTIASFDQAANYSAFSATVTATGSISGPPPQVTGVTANAGNEGLTLAWTESTADDVTKYEVQIATDSAFTTGPGVDGAPLDYVTGNTSITIAGLAEGTTYYYRVRAIDTTNTSGAWSTTASVTLGTYPGGAASDGVVPAAAGAPNVSGGIGYLFVSWQPVTTNASGGAQKDPVIYEVHVSTTSGFTPSSSTKVAEVSGTVVTLDKDAGGTELAYSTTYYVVLIAKDNDGSAPASPQSSGTLSQATSSDIISLAVDKLASGAISSAVITMTSTGTIQSNNYVAGSTGWKIGSAGIEMNDSGSVIKADALKGGSITATTISLGINGVLSVDGSSGVIRSNNYAPGSTGWQLGYQGLEINNGSVKASTLVSGTIGAQTITISSGGVIQSSDYNATSQTGWSLGGATNALTIYNGTISGSAIKTGQISSNTYVIRNGVSVPSWSINLNGNAVFNDALVSGHLVVGNGYQTDSYVQSGNYVPGSSGWRIRGDGYAEFMNTTVTGAFQTNTGGTGVSITSGGGLKVTDPSQSGNFIRMDPSTDSWGGTQAQILLSYYGTANNGKIRVQSDGMWIEYGANSSLGLNGSALNVNTNLYANRGATIGGGTLYAGATNFSSIYTSGSLSVGGNVTSPLYVTNTVAVNYTGTDVILRQAPDLASNGGMFGSSSTGGAVVLAGGPNIRMTQFGQQTLYIPVWADSFVTKSEQRFKANLAAVTTGALSTLKSIGVYDYDSVDSPKVKNSVGHMVAPRRRGVLIDEIGPQVPNIVQAITDAKDTANNHQGIDLYGLLSTAIAAIKELSAQVDDLQAQVGGVQSDVHVVERARNASDAGAVTASEVSQVVKS